MFACPLDRDVVRLRLSTRMDVCERLKLRGLVGIADLNMGNTRID